MAAIEPFETKDGRRYGAIYRTPERKQTSMRGFRTKRDAELFLATIPVSKARGVHRCGGGGEGHCRRARPRLAQQAVTPQAVDHAHRRGCVAEPC